MPLDSVKVPPQYEALFAKAQQLVREYHAARSSDPTRGTIELHGHRYIQVRAASMSVEFFDLVSRLYRDDAGADEVARSLLFDVAHAIGLADARDFNREMGVEDPIERLSAGPMHFAHNGWAFVELDEASRPDVDDFMLVYDHPYSFEADSWLRAGRRSDSPVCVMSAGYSSGWTEAAFGIPLVAAELLCKGRGDDRCHFVMGRPDELRDKVQAYVATRPDLAQAVGTVRIPGFFEERRRAAAVLERSQARFRSAFEHAGVGMAIVATDGTVVQANAAAGAILGYDHQELAGRPFDAFVVPERASQDWQTFSEVIVAAVPVTTETEMLGADGRRVQVRVTASPLRDEAGGVGQVLIQAIDLSRQRRAEDALRQRDEELQRARRLEALGRLAGGMAHDFNNLLTVIMGYSEQLQLTLQGHPASAQAQRIADAADKASSLTQKLLAISRRQVLKPDVIDIERVVSGVRDMLERLVRDDVELHIELPPRLWHAEVDPTQLEQALVNLTLNASDAMPRGGSLRIAFDNVDLGAGPAADRGIAPGRYVRTTVRDDGEGMDDATVKRVFEPFYTTKSGGLGLGTASVYGFVQQSGGAISVESKPGRGTTFRFLLPAAAAGRARLPRRNTPPQSDAQGEVVLLVDDNPDIRSLLEEQLDGLGYDVRVASDGAQAVAVSSGLERVDLLITDVIMPGMNGPEAASAIAMAHDGLRVLFMTGYADDDVQALPEGATVLTKPFSLVQLQRMVRRLLDD